jgi:hypothetical protein
MKRGKRWKRVMASAVVCGMMILAAVSPGRVGASSLRWSYSELAAEWWKWVYSIPCTETWCPNPAVDEAGDYCAVGQHGDVWFLAGTFFGGTPTRECSIPEDKALFFPVINCSFFDSPNACAQGDFSYSVKDLRAQVAGCIKGVTDLWATLDGKPLRLQHTQSVVFELAMPKDNLYDLQLIAWGYPDLTCAPGIYSPSVDEGYYVLLNPLKPGNHVLHIHGDGWLDVTYNLTVVPVKLR